MSFQISKIDTDRSLARVLRGGNKDFIRIVRLMCVCWAIHTPLKRTIAFHIRVRPTNGWNLFFGTLTKQSKGHPSLNVTRWRCPRVKLRRFWVLFTSRYMVEFDIDEEDRGPCSNLKMGSSLIRNGLIIQEASQLRSVSVHQMHALPGDLQRRVHCKQWKEDPRWSRWGEAASGEL